MMRSLRGHLASGVEAVLLGAEVVLVVPWRGAIDCQAESRRVEG
jgi:hypothetical protein